MSRDTEWGGAGNPVTWMHTGVFSWPAGSADGLSWYPTSQYSLTEWPTGIRPVGKTPPYAGAGCAPQSPCTAGWQLAPASNSPLARQRGWLGGDIYQVKDMRSKSSRYRAYTAILTVVEGV